MKKLFDDKILGAASDKHTHEIQRSENYDSKATNLITALGVVVTLMGSLFTYALISWSSSNPAQQPLEIFYPILISGLTLLIISIGLAIMIINPVGKKVSTKINLEEIHNSHKNDPDDSQITEKLVKYYHNFINELQDVNEQKRSFFKYSTISALIGLTLFSIAAIILITQYVHFK